MSGIVARGRNELKSYKEGKRLTQRQAIYAKCYDCMGGYVDGRTDCGILGCSLYPWMPYKGKKKIACFAPGSLPEAKGQKT